VLTEIEVRELGQMVQAPGILLRKQETGDREQGTGTSEAQRGVSVRIKSVANGKWLVTSRKIAALLVFLFFALATHHSALLYGQTGTAGVSGEITDSQNKAIPGVDVEVKNVDTGVSSVTKTNGDGFYSVPGLQPGHYLMSVRKDQFRTVSVTGITLNVQDNLSRNFVLQIGSSAESITVEGGGINMNTTDAAVSTVIDRNFVENIPLNGRSFQDLLALTPGAVFVGTQTDPATLGNSLSTDSARRPITSPSMASARMWGRRLNKDLELVPVLVVAPRQRRRWGQRRAWFR
jgi:Carboxypeptidase regulatory-like domain